jgi:hypothetical protein
MLFLKKIILKQVFFFKIKTKNYRFNFLPEVRHIYHNKKKLLQTLNTKNRLINVQIFACNQRETMLSSKTHTGGRPFDAFLASLVPGAGARGLHALSISL